VCSCRLSRGRLTFLNQGRVVCPEMHRPANDTPGDRFGAAKSLGGLVEQPGESNLLDKRADHVYAKGAKRGADAVE